MDKATEKSTRRIRGDYQSAPGAAIMVEHDMVPTAAWLDNKQEGKVVKLLRQPEDHPVEKRTRN